jgi:hypothetical protein
MAYIEINTTVNPVSSDYILIYEFEVFVNR